VDHRFRVKFGAKKTPGGTNVRPRQGHALTFIRHPLREERRET
jgi:hypothetical protein